MEELQHYFLLIQGKIQVRSKLMFHYQVLDIFFNESNIDCHNVQIGYSRTA